MSYQNFMAADIMAVTQGFLLAGLFTFVPGYVFGWLTDALGFRRLETAWKLALSIPLSIALCPILTYLAGHYFSMKFVWSFYGVIWLGFLMLSAQNGRTMAASLINTLSNRRRLIFFSIALGWIIIGTLSLVDLQLGGRLYFSVVAFDHSVRAAITDAISRTGIPPQNPFFYPGHSTVLRYHYFWLILSSLTDQIAGDAIGPRQAMIACTLWCGLGLLAITFLYLRFFSLRSPLSIRKRALLAAGLFTVTGLDLIPTFLLLAFNVVLPEMEWWNEQVTSWIGSVLWVPHHLGSLIACLTGFLILWTPTTSSSGRTRFLQRLAAALAFATTAGSSVYVALVFAVFAGVWMAVTVIKRWYSETVALLSSSALALLLSLPYLQELHSAAAGERFVRLTVRSFFFSFGLQPSWHVTLANAVALPLNYFLEFGFFFLVGLTQFRWWRSRKWNVSRDELCGGVMLATSFLICTFFRSGVIANNDLGMRAPLFAQFILLLWSVNVLDQVRLKTVQGADSQSDVSSVSPGLKRLMVPLLVIGVAGSLYEIVILRVFPIMSDANMVTKYFWLSTDDALGRRTYALRQAYEQLRKQLPADAVVQHNPDAVPNDLYFGLYAGRQAAADTSKCGAGFGGDAAACAPIHSRLQDLFAGREADPDRICRDLSIDILVVKDTDGIWKCRDSWVWTRKPILANNYVRVFAASKEQLPHAHKDGA